MQVSPRVIVMGVSGCGKTTLGAALAARIGARFQDADDLHPPENRAKMSAGLPLTDSDRAPWLARIGRLLAESEGPVVIACSALKRAYRAALTEAAGSPAPVFLHLSGPPELFQARLAARKGHFMPASLLESQFAALEPPGADEKAFSINAALPPEAQLDAALKFLRDAPPQP